MTLKSYLWGMRIAAVLTFAVWVLILQQIDPDSSGIVGKIFFFASTFLFLASWFILFFTWLRKKIFGEENVLSHLGISFRQGALISLLAVTLLFLQSTRVLTWWDSMLTVAGVMLAELYFLTRK